MMHFVSETTQVELKSERVSAPAVNQPVAAQMMARVVVMDAMHPRNCTMIPGRMMSMVSVSRLKRLMMRPDGHVSKNLMAGADTCPLFGLT